MNPETITLSNIEENFSRITKTKEWHIVEESFRNSNIILIIGNGGNLAVADHAAIDISRLTNKSASAPGSGILTSSIINDFGHDKWLEKWVEIQLRGLPSKALNKLLVIGFSSSGRSENVFRALNYARDNGIQTALISSLKPTYNVSDSDVILNINHYHSAEALTLLLTYQLTHSSGFECPKISNSLDSDNNEIIEAESKYKNEEKRNLAIDFDGVIHDNNNGFADGRISGKPVKGTYEALSKLCQLYDLILLTSKALSDRPLIDGKTGTELVWEWLKNYKLDKFIKRVTAYKPRACYYIDDKAIKFLTWEDTLKAVIKKTE